MKRKLTLILCIVIVALGLTGCGTEETVPKEENIAVLDTLNGNKSLSS